MKPTLVKKPWGQFEQFTHNESSTVKIITVDVGQALSLQYHARRTEFWKILSGNPTITIGDKTIVAKPGDELTIVKLQKHRIEAPTTKVQILEIASGDFDEDDIVRLEDNYGRVTS